MHFVAYAFGAISAREPCWTFFAFAILHNMPDSVAVPRVFVDFLDTVDGPGVKDMDFIKRAAVAFVASEVWSYWPSVPWIVELCPFGQASSQVDLIGFDVDGVPKSLTNKGDGTPSPGLRGFMKRAVEKVS